MPLWQHGRRPLTLVMQSTSPLTAFYAASSSLLPIQTLPSLPSTYQQTLPIQLQTPFLVIYLSPIFTDSCCHSRRNKTNPPGQEPLSLNYTGVRPAMTASHKCFSCMSFTMPRGRGFHPAYYLLQSPLVWVFTLHTHYHNFISLLSIPHNNTV